MGATVDFKNAGESLAEMNYIDDAKDFPVDVSSVLPARRSQSAQHSSYYYA